jgi:hypothetical protein
MTYPLLAGWLGDTVDTAWTELLHQALFIVLPFVIIAVLLHLLERKVQRTLMQRWGYWSLLCTGWLGTPIHEFSHAGMCKVFGHKIEALAPLAMDKRTGKMGYVIHTHNPKSWYQRIGNVFIGTAPLLGGALVLLLLLLIFFPGAARLNFSSGEGAMAGGNLVSVTKNVVQRGANVIDRAVRDGLFTSLHGWLFLYLVLCIGTHLAPSASDYKGARSGAFLLLALVVIGDLIYAAVGGHPGGTLRVMAPVLTPLLALLGLALTLSAIVTLVVFIIMSFLGVAFGANTQHRKRQKNG